MGERREAKPDYIGGYEDEFAVDYDQELDDADFRILMTELAASVVQASAGPAEAREIIDGIAERNGLADEQRNALVAGVERATGWTLRV